MNDSLFRKVSIERLSSPEQIDQLMKIKNSSGWIIAITAALILLSGILWMFLGYVPTTTECSGVIIPHDGLTIVQSEYDSCIKSIAPSNGRDITKDCILATVEKTETKEIYYITSPCDGRIVDVMADVGHIIQAGTPIVSIEPKHDAKKGGLEALVCIPVEDGVKIKPGMESFISPANINLDEYGYIRGRVASVSPYPATEQAMLHDIGNDSLVKEFMNNGVIVTVRILFTFDKDNYSWTYNKIPNESIRGGTPCTGYVLLGKRHPISLLFNLQ